MAPSVPEDLRRFILTSVPSVPFIEALLIFRDAGGAAISLDLLARRLYVGELQAAEVVAALRAARIVDQLPDGTGHRYAPDAAILPMLDELARLYRSHLVEVTALIHSRTGRMAQQFADAFKLRKD
jgi:hypothetical protein